MRGSLSVGPGSPEGSLDPDSDTEVKKSPAHLRSFVVEWQCKSGLIGSL